MPATDAVPVPIKTRNNSLARKFKNLMKSSDNHNGEHNNSDKSSPSRRGSVISGLHPSTSYDQTKLSMTTSRTKGLLNKLISGDRRMSEQPGTYKKNKNKKKKKKWIISISSLSLCNAGFKLDQMNSNFIANFMLKNNANF